MIRVLVHLILRKIQLSTAICKLVWFHMPILLLTDQWQGRLAINTKSYRRCVVHPGSFGRRRCDVGGSHWSDGGYRRRGLLFLRFRRQLLACFFEKLHHRFLRSGIQLARRSDHLLKSSRESQGQNWFVDLLGWPEDGCVIAVAVATVSRRAPSWSISSYENVNLIDFSDRN